MRTKEVNRLKDKMYSLSLNSSKSELVEFIVLQIEDRFKSNNKNNQKLNYPKQLNKFSSAIQKPKELCYVCDGSRHKAHKFPLCKGQSQLKPRLTLLSTQKSSVLWSKRQIWWLAALNESMTLESRDTSTLTKNYVGL